MNINQKISLVSKIFACIILSMVLSGCQPTAISTSQTQETAKTIDAFGYIFNITLSKFNQTYLEYNNGKEIITLKVIQNIDSEIADSISSDRVTLFASIFEPKRADYPGQYTQTIVCPDAFKPKYYESHNNKLDETEVTKYFVGYANANMVAGACSDDLIHYKHIYGFMSCKQQDILVEIEYFSVLELNNTQQFIQNLNCDTLSKSFI